MKVSLNWLQDHLDIKGHPVSEIAETLTFAGVEVEDIAESGRNLEKVVVARVLSSDPHPDADRLSICQVDDGSGAPRQIVCGAKNYRVGDKVPLALPGAVLGENFKIKKGKLRGQTSEGMMCSPGELGLPGDDDGLLILSTEAAEGTPLAELFPPDTSLDLEITPNRPDLLSYRGIAREISALTDKPLLSPDSTRIPEVTATPAPADQVKITAGGHCPFYSARRIGGISVKPSPQWLQDKLNAAGLRPINNVVDITNYVLLETGQPLHAFDAARIDGGLLVRLARPGEKFLALDGEEHSLGDEDVVIADRKKALALGGVMGGEDSGVTAATRDIVLESAYFTPPCIRRTSRRHNLSSDSSYRFERGVNPAGVLEASSLATRLIVEIAGGTPEAETLAAGELPANPGDVELHEEKARALLGVDLEGTVMHEILARLGLEKKGGDNGQPVSKWHIPSHRLDLLRHIDLVEEIARVYGLEKIPATTAASIAELGADDHDYDADARLRARLCNLGFFETKTIKLISESQMEDQFITLDPGAGQVRLKNPLSDEHAILRPSLLPPLLEVARRNLHQGASSLRFFEMGTVFQTSPKEDTPCEEQYLALLMGGETAVASWHDARPRETDFFDLRGVIEALLPGKILTFERVDGGSLILEVAVSLDGAGLGRAGQLPPARARAMDASFPIFVAELRLDLFYAALREPLQFEELDRFPAMTRDIAMEVPADLPNATLNRFFEGREEPLLVDARLFDVFFDESGKKLSADKKSLAYSLTYRDKESTLTAETVDEAHAKILDALVKDLPVQVR